MSILIKDIIDGFNISLEAVDGKLAKELEFCMYAELLNVDDLKKAASKELHEQWTLVVDDESGRKARLRAINDARWVLTAKSKIEGGFGSNEVECDISRDMYEQLVKLCFDGYVKTRYMFPAENTGLTWEVDVFLDQAGGQHPWVKIDLEVTSPDQELPQLPFGVRSIIYADNPNMSSAEKGIIKNLWDKEWVCREGKDTSRRVLDEPTE